MRNKVHYEWDIETVDAHGDIEDHRHADKLEDLPPGCDSNERLVLVWNYGNPEDGILDRLWAYVEDGKLPHRFEDGRGNEQVPVLKKHHRELAKSAHGSRL